jgi:hypothetical protein
MNAVTAFGAVIAPAQATAHSNDIFFQSTGRWIKSFFATTMATNSISTGRISDSLGEYTY